MLFGNWVLMVCVCRLLLVCIARRNCLLFVVSVCCGMFFLYVVGCFVGGDCRSLFVVGVSKVVVC